MAGAATTAPLAVGALAGVGIGTYFGSRPRLGFSAGTHADLEEREARANQPRSNLT